MEVLSKKLVDARKEFVAKASLCEFNHLWTCLHPANDGKRCTSICNKYNAYKEE